MKIKFTAGPPTHPGLFLTRVIEADKDDPEKMVASDDRGSFCSPIIIDESAPVEIQQMLTGGNESTKDNFIARIQFNFSVSKLGVIRGIHAEPWNKWITVVQGRVFVAIVNLRDPEHYGEVFTTVLEPGMGLFIPKGFGNSFQALEDDTIYTYIVDDIWRPGPPYPCVHPLDKDLNIPWPNKEWVISDKDLKNPSLIEARKLFFSQLADNS